MEDNNMSQNIQSQQPQLEEKRAPAMAGMPMLLFCILLLVGSTALFIFGSANGSKSKH